MELKFLGLIKHFFFIYLHIRILETFLSNIFPHLMIFHSSRASALQFYSTPFEKYNKRRKNLGGNVFKISKIFINDIIYVYDIILKNKLLPKWTMLCYVRDTYVINYSMYYPKCMYVQSGDRA